MNRIVLAFADVGLIALGMAFAASAERWITARIAGRSAQAVLAGPWRNGAAWMLQQRSRTEHPDALTWALAPALYFTVAVAGLAVVPWAQGQALADLPAGVVLWGACEALAIVAIFLNGWSANAPLPLIGGYRYVALGLPAMLLSMFVLIGAALPAQSLSVSAIVEAQRPIWNLVRQPLGLPLFMAMGLAITLRGPFDQADSADLAGGTAAELSGPARLVWSGAKLAMLTAFSAMGASAFLGGYLGPWLPGPLWLVLKTLLLLALTLALGHQFARPPPARLLTWLWIVLLPLAFLDLVVAGVLAL